jgi:sodium-dependent dicarboxylate transporter 2/3/5
MSTKAAPPVKKQDPLHIHIIKVLICFFFLFVFGKVIPPFGTVTAMGVEVIGIFISMILMCSWFDTAWPPLIVIPALVLCDYTTTSDFISRMLGNTNIFQMIILLGMSFALRTSGIGEVIAKWIITRKSLKGRPVLFLAAFYLAIYVSAIFLQYGAFFLGWEILYEILDVCGYKKKERTSSILVIGVFSAAFMGYAALPMSGLIIAMVATFNSVMEGTGYMITTASYAAVTLPVGIIMMPIQALAVKYLFRADLSGLKDLDIEKLNIGKDDLKVTRKQAILVIGFFLALFYAVLLSFVSKESAIGIWMNKLTQYGWFCIVIAALSIIRVDEKPVFEASKSFSQGVFWGPLLCTGSFVIIGGALTSDQCGIKDGIVELLTPVFGNMSWFIFVLLAIAATVLVTNFLSNLAIGVVVISLVAPFVVNYVSSGITPIVLGVGIIVSAMQGELTMSAGAYAPLLVCNEWINGQKDCFKYGFPMMAVYVVFGSIMYAIQGLIY